MIDEFDENVHFVEIDIEEDPEIAEAAGIMGTPCVQFFKNKEMIRLVKFTLQLFFPYLSACYPLLPHVFFSLVSVCLYFPAVHLAILVFVILFWFWFLFQGVRGAFVFLESSTFRFEDYVYIGVYRMNGSDHHN